MSLLIKNVFIAHNKTEKVLLLHPAGTPLNVTDY